MLNRLRLYLTLLCVFITGAILFLMTAIELGIYEKQLFQSNANAFENICGQIAYRIQFDKLIKQSWLRQMEAENNMIIHIEDNGDIFAFNGAVRMKTDRDVLIEKTKSISASEYAIDSDKRLTSGIEIRKAIFSLVGDYKEPYAVSVHLIPATYGKSTLVVIQDMAPLYAERNANRIRIAVISFAGILMLVFFSWWFSGRAIRPIEQNLKKQEEFIASASHELKTPLAVATTTAWALKQCKPSEQEGFVDTLIKECKRMASLVDDLLVLSTADAKAWSVMREVIDIDTLLIEAMDAFLPVAKKRGQTLELSLPETSVPVVMGDKDRLMQVFTILLDNAITYTPENGVIKMVLSAGSSHVTVRIEDNGVGIPDEHKKHVFDRFYRVDKSRSKKDHYGLGLSIAKELVTMHGGQIFVTDTKGGGATFVVRLTIG